MNQVDAPHFPGSEDMQRLLAHIEAAGARDTHGLGLGCVGDPVFPVEVQLTGRDGNAYSIIGNVQRTITKWVRRNTDSDDKWAELVHTAIWSELRAGSYQELLYRAQCLANAI